MVCGFVTSLGLLLFTGLSGLDWEDYRVAFYITVLIGFLVPFLYLKLQERRFYKAFDTELDIEGGCKNS